MVKEALLRQYSKTIQECTDREIYEALLNAVNDMAARKEESVGKKKLYYISSEFLTGKLLSNNMINLGVYDEVRNELDEAGRSLADIEEIEPEPSLGSGSRGMLAASFLDSIATLGLNGDGIGLNYHMGFFKQEFRNGLQYEKKNPWIDRKGWLNKTDVTFTVNLGDMQVKSRMYDILVTGYDSRTNRLHLFDLETVDETLVKDGIRFDKEEIGKNLTLFLYPDDSDEAGRLLRVYQQYFMASSAAQFILYEAKERGCKLIDLDEYAAIQINGTYPAMIIPELIRLLVAEGISADEAVEIVVKTCAYTNNATHTEELEEWPIEYLEKAVPQLVPVIKELDGRIREKYKDNSIYIIDFNKLVHMAHIAIHYGCSVNGVSHLNTEMLKNKELNDFYKIYPEKFNNKADGITFRRWLLYSNEPLADFITDLIGDGYKKDSAQLKKLEKYVDDEKALKRLIEIKKEAKAELCWYLSETQGAELDEDSVFDIQVKELCEYNRQQMNILYVIHKYLEIKGGKKPARPISVIFGAKAAPTDVPAKDIIHLILCMQELVNNEPEVNPYLNVVMIKNYNVTKAEKVIPACDISEQISPASRETSGISGMKFMLNGAVTLGTYGGANVKICECAGMDNEYIFGKDADSVIGLCEKGSYIPMDYYEKREVIKETVDFIVSDELLAIGNEENLDRLYGELLNNDKSMTLLDFEEYIKVKDKAFADYEDRMAWAKKMLYNIANAGFFSSDRMILEYNRDIWKL